MFINVSHSLKKLSTYFPEHLYVVGGYVRNQLLKLKSGDVDLASSVDIEQVSKRLEGTGFSVKIKNLKTGSLLISSGNESYEYTMFRKDIYENDGSHSPLRVERTARIEEDAERRDFSINAIYYDINTDEVTDLYHGIIDLKDRIIRTVQSPEEVLKFDGERILRLVRIAGELDFEIEKETFKTAKKYASNVKNLNGNRKFAEIEKILYCDKRYNLGKGGLKRALLLLNKLAIWKHFGLSKSQIKYKMVYKVEDRLLGLLIDIVNTQKPACLEAFLEKFLIQEFATNEANARKIFTYLGGYFDALSGMNNKQYFLTYYTDWAKIFALLGGKSKRVQAKYNFYYKYIIEHGLVVEKESLKIDEAAIKKAFPKIDERCYERILKSLLSKVFDEKLENSKKELLEEIERNKQNY